MSLYEDTTILPDTVAGAADILDQLDTATLTLLDWGHVLYSQGVVKWVLAPATYRNIVTATCFYIYIGAEIRFSLFTLDPSSCCTQNSQSCVRLKTLILFRKLTFHLIRYILGSM